jgi:putative DNA methylase
VSKKSSFNRALWSRLVWSGIVARHVGPPILAASGIQAAVRTFLRLLHLFIVIVSERRLPHRDVIGHPVFVTFRLAGSLPRSRFFSGGEINGGRSFVAMDRLLDEARTGPRYLLVPEVAEAVVAALKRGNAVLRHYELGSYVVMPNHVHVLATPRVNRARWLGPLKGFSAHEANRILRRSGSVFWQDESYDHLVKSEREFERIQRYIENNPVKAGLVTQAEEFRWSSAYGATR